MSYRCSFCNDKVPHGVPLKRFTTYRPNRQIASERPICGGCIEFVGRGKIPSTTEPIQVQRVEAVSQVETRRIKPQPVAAQVKPSPIKGKAGAVGVGLGGLLNLKNGRIETKTKTKKGK